MSFEISDTIESKSVRLGTQVYYIGIARAYETSFTTNSYDTESDSDERSFVFGVRVDDILLCIDPTETESLSDIRKDRSRLAGNSGKSICYNCENSVSESRKAKRFSVVGVSDGIAELDSTDRYTRLCLQCISNIISGVADYAEGPFKSYFIAQSI